MASSSSHDGLFQEVNQVNPFEILGITPRTSFRDAHKQYLKLIRKHHSDKVGGDDSFTKLLTQAWQLLNDTGGDANKWRELAKQFYDFEEEEEATPPEIIDIDKFFIDRSKSTEFRELFQSVLKQKEEFQFKENFQSFYGQIFAQLQVYKRLKPEFQCEICDGEEFLLFEDHSKAVFYPYYDFVVEAGPQKRTGFKKYLSNLFGEEAVDLSTETVQSMDYTVHVSNDTNHHFRKMMESLQQQNYEQSTSNTEQLIQNYSTLCRKADRIVKIMENRIRFPSAIQAVLESVSFHDDGKDLPSVEHRCCCEALISALIKTKRPEVKKWDEVAVQIYDRGFKDWSLVFVKAAVYFGDEDACVQLAEHLIRKEDYVRAHLCFTKIGCCDLNAIGNWLASKRIGIKMAAQYLVKTEDVKGLFLHGKSYCSADGSGNRKQAAMFLIPLIFMFKKKRLFNQAIKVLNVLLPKSMYFRAVQELAADLIDTVDGFSIYKNEGIAVAVLSEVERICEGTLLGKVPDIEGDGENGVLSLKMDHRLNALNAIPGALHVLRGSPNKNCYSDPSGLWERLVTPLLREALRLKQLELVLILAKFPGMEKTIEKVLTENGMMQQLKGGMERKYPIQPPQQVYVSGLLLLRAIYNYKKNQISDMLVDLDKANLLAIGHSKLMKPIVYFIDTTPMVHEKIVNGMTSQFLELRKFLEGKCKTSFPKNVASGFLSEVSHTGLLTGHLNAGTIIDLEVVEKNILMNSDPPEEVAMNYLDLVKMAPRKAAISCYTQAIAYFYKAMQSRENIAIKYAYMQLIEKVCEMLELVAVYDEFHSEYLSLYALRTKLLFLPRAHFHLNQAINKFNKQTNFPEILEKFFPTPVVKSIIGLSCGGNEKIPTLVGQWQHLLNLRSFGDGMSGYGKTGYQAAAAGGPSGSCGGNNAKKGRALPTHSPERKNEFPNDPTRICQIFKEKSGHFPNYTPQAREQLTKLVNKEKHYERTDHLGNRWYSKTLRNGDQLWAFTQNNVLWDGGINKAGDTRMFNSTTGMCAK